ncbi:MAG: hypothetical protein Kow0065_03820 [Methylomicrobium sp.]
MVAKELNAALSDDKLREQWLKRILPALAVTVVYFVFISSTLVEKSDKAEDAYSMMMSKGISEQVVPGMEMQKSSLQDELVALRTKNEALQAGLGDKAGFLSESGDMNETIAKMAALLQRHRLRLVDDRSLGEKTMKELPKSYADLQRWLIDMLHKSDSVRVHRLSFIGGYSDAYAALREIALGDMRVLPLTLSMKDIENGQELHPGAKEWTLDLWI